jgi:hypothetical protein
MKYTKGYKYQLEQNEYFKTDIFEYDIEWKFIRVKPSGIVVIKSGYAWDGPSGPTFDTKNFMRGSLIHDALYELMDRDLLPVTFKDYADDYLIKVCAEDGMSTLRQWWVYEAVQAFGKPGNYKKKKPMLEAP